MLCCAAPRVGAQRTKCHRFAR
uniref:Uncharacterized protein n=1 Tax=Arundo donax TaxID=35708 RepID=A0A0A9BBM7_ARUDO